MVQWIAHLTSNQGDVGSSPAQGIKTNFFRTSVYINTGLTRTKTSRSGIIHKSQPHYQFRNRNCYRNPMGNWFVENTIHSNEEINWAPGRNLTAIHMHLVNSLCCQHGKS